MQTFPTIHSLNEIDPYLPELNEDEWGIISLDFDQTLVLPKLILASEHVYYFVKQKNVEHGIQPRAHVYWTFKMRESTPYQTCENVEEINDLLKKWRMKGWTIKILTARIQNTADAAFLHLQSSGLDLTPEDMIFSDRDEEIHQGSVKDDLLINWMKKQEEWKKKRKVYVFSADDRYDHCISIKKISEKIHHIAVSCFHYLAKPAEPNLTQEQLTQSLVQLHAYHLNIPIPNDEEALLEDRVQAAKRGFCLAEITAQAVYEKIMQISGLIDTKKGL